jgi:hypothetical protein
MNKLNLMLHAGGQSVDRNQLINVPTPEATDTWYPIPHFELLDQVTKTLQRSGLEIVSEAHGLARDGNRYFGMLQVANGHNPDDYGLVVGLRNSHDKSFPGALALGSGVFVCDNLAFSGEIKLARKHTRFIRNDLPGLVQKAVGLLGAHREKQDLRIAAYKQHELQDIETNNILINALDADIIGATQLPKVLAEWRNPLHEDFKPRTAWSLFNAFTEIAKGNVNLAYGRTQKLHGLMDSVCNIVTAA